MQSCPQCNQQNPDISRYCSHCGYPFPGASTGRLSPHTLLADRYAIVKLLGKGGMGAVYLASDSRIAGKVWAVKEMSDAALLDPAEKQAAINAFQTEASLLATLDHPNIPKVVDYFNEAGKHYLVMDFVLGKTLEMLMEERGSPLPENQVVQLGVQLCNVLSYLHSRRPPVIFRDLKPSNVMLQPDGTVKLIDFGIARVFKPGRSVDTTVIGTPGFAAPEQHGRAQTDARSDVYSLGVLLHHLATSHDPASDPFNLPSARRLVSQISSQFEGVVARATALEISHRYQTAAAMSQALLGASSGSSPVHGPITVQPQPATQGRGGRWSFAMLAIVVVAALAVAIPVLTKSPPDPPEMVVVTLPTPAPPAPTDTPVLGAAGENTSSPRLPEPATMTPTATQLTPIPVQPASTSTPTRPRPTPLQPTPTPNMTTIQAEVETVLLRWSDIHKRAVRQVREDELYAILADEALEKQLGSIRWMRDNNAYWDVTTYARRTDAWEYITPTFVRVLVWRDEKGDYYQNGRLYSKSSYQQAYQARFVLENIDGQWFITCKGSLESGKPEPCLLASP